MATNLHNLDATQVLELIYDQTKNRIRTDASVSIDNITQEIIIDHTYDSIRLGDGVNLITATTVGADVGLDVNIIGGVDFTVALDAFTKVPADNAIAVGTEDGTQTGTKHAILIGADLNLRVKDEDATTQLGLIRTAAESLATTVTGTQLRVDVIASLPAGANVIGAVTQSGAWNVTDITGTITLPTGAATEATLSAINGKLNTLGQKAMALSVPVVLASDQTVIPVSQSGSWNITNITGTITLPTGAATEATLDALSAKFGTLGQKTMAGSAPVVLASDQSAIPATQSGTWTNQLFDGTDIALITTTGDLQTVDFLNTAIENTNISVTTTEIEAKVGGARLTNRKWLSVTPTNGTIYFGKTGVTITTGTPIFTNQTATFEIGNIALFLISAGTVNACIVEGS